MKRTTWAAAAAALALGLSACAGDDIRTPSSEGEGNGSTETTPAGEAAGDDTCSGYFETGGPLSDRAEASLQALGAGEVTDAISWQEASMLDQRISTLIADADGDHAALLERINAPFEMVVDDYLAAEAAVDPEDEEADPYAELGSYDVSDAEAAHEEFRAACEG